MRVEAAAHPRRPLARALALALALALTACSGGQVEGEGAAPVAAAEAPAEAREDGPLPAPKAPETVRGERLLAEASSAYSRIRVRQKGTRRTLGFVRERGDEFVQTIVDLERPDQPAHPYIEAMAAPFLVAADPRRVLMIGLGGGTLVRVVHAHAPRAVIDAVEIDPEVVRLAAEWFGVVPGPRLRVVTADGVEFLAGEGEAYDVIWLDAFLDPGAPGTDVAGVPEALRGTGFLQRVRARLRPGGVAAFNIHYLSGYRAHVDAIASVFPRVLAGRAPGSSELVVLALADDRAIEPAALTARAAELEAGGWGFSFARLAEALRPWQPAPP